jgi:hypothetical protein
MFHPSEIEIPQRRDQIVFSHTGLQSGPSLAIVGRASEMEKIAARMEKIPSLGYMRGSITIYAVEEEASATRIPEVDDVLVLLDRSEEFTSNPLAALYWKVLARAASLGIIAGRGVPLGSTRVVWH